MFFRLVFSGMYQSCNHVYFQGNKDGGFAPGIWIYFFQIQISRVISSFRCFKIYHLNSLKPKNKMITQQKSKQKCLQANLFMPSVIGCALMKHNLGSRSDTVSSISYISIYFPPFSFLFCIKVTCDYVLCCTNHICLLTYVYRQSFT